MKSEQTKSEQKYYRGMPVKDADRPLYMQLEKVDIEKGVPQDPENCAFALCLKRNLGTQYARIDRTCALVETLENERSILTRYMVKSRTRSYIEIFDKDDIRDAKGNLRVPICLFKLWPPSASERLDYKAPERKIPYANSKPLSQPQLKEKGVTYGAIPSPKPEPIRASPLRNSTGKIRFDNY